MGTTNQYNDLVMPDDKNYSVLKHIFKNRNKNKDINVLTS